MKFQFNLQKVLDHRKVLMDLAEKDFSEAMGHLNNQKKILRDLDQQEFDARQEVGRLIGSSESDVPSRLKQIHEFMVLQAQRIEMQKTKIQEAEKGVESKREILREKAIQHKILERLREKKKQQFDEERKKLEQKEIDEINVLRFEVKEV